MGFIDIWHFHFNDSNSHFVDARVALCRTAMQFVDDFIRFIVLINNRKVIC